MEWTWLKDWWRLKNLKKLHQRRHMNVNDREFDVDNDNTDNDENNVAAGGSQSVANKLQGSQQRRGRRRTRRGKPEQVNEAEKSDVEVVQNAASVHDEGGVAADDYDDDADDDDDELDDEDDDFCYCDECLNVGFVLVFLFCYFYFFSFL